jgi:hypothetical protein
MSQIKRQNTLPTGKPRPRQPRTILSPYPQLPSGAPRVHETLPSAQQPARTLCKNDPLDCSRLQRELQPGLCRSTRRLCRKGHLLPEHCGISSPPTPHAVSCPTDHHCCTPRYGEGNDSARTGNARPGTPDSGNLSKDAPESRAIQANELERIVQIPQLGGLHHRYERRAA